MDSLRASLHRGIEQFQKVSLVPKLLCGVFVLLHGLGYIPGAEDNLIVTPGYLVPPHAKLWTLVTGVFYENNIVWVVLDIVAMVGFSLLLEPLWGLKEFLIFSAIVGCLSSLSVAMISISIYAITGSLTVLFVQLHGFVGLVCGYLVGVKQAHPDSVAFPPPAPPTLRVKHLPLLVIMIAFILAVTKLISYTYTLLAFSGMTISWTYLRFYQKHDLGVKGDMSETFAFATFFPEILHPSVMVLGEALFRVLVRLRICRKVVTTYDVSGPSTIKIALPGATPADAERRKQRALKALDERLNKSAETSQITWPSLDDNASSDDQATPTATPNSNTTAKPPPPATDNQPS